MIEIQHIEGERFRFHAVSRSRKGLQHLVDLEEYDGNGWCSCEDFQFHLQPQLERNPKGAWMRCDHIREAREFFIDREILLSTVQKPAHKRGQFKGITGLSDRQKLRLAEYEKSKRVFLQLFPFCEVFPNEASTDVHHSRGRTGDLLFDIRYWKAVSRTGHNWIDQNRDQSRKHGLLCEQGQWLKQEPDERTECSKCHGIDCISRMFVVRELAYCLGCAKILLKNR